MGEEGNFLPLPFKERMDHDKKVLNILKLIEKVKAEIMAEEEGEEADEAKKASSKKAEAEEEVDEY